MRPQNGIAKCGCSAQLLPALLSRRMHNLAGHAQRASTPPPASPSVPQSSHAASGQPQAAGARQQQQPAKASRGAAGGPVQPRKRLKVGRCLLAAHEEWVASGGAEGGQDWATVPPIWRAAYGPFLFLRWAGHARVPGCFPACLAPPTIPSPYWCCRRRAAAQRQRRLWRSTRLWAARCSGTGRRTAGGLRGSYPTTTPPRGSTGESPQAGGAGLGMGLPGSGGACRVCHLPVPGGDSSLGAACGCSAFGTCQKGQARHVGARAQKAAWPGPPPTMHNPPCTLL